MLGMGSWNGGNRVLECWEWGLGMLGIGFGMLGIGSWNDGNRVLGWWE